MADVLRAVVMADGQAIGDILADGPEAFSHPLTYGLKRFEACAPHGRVDAHTAGRTMVGGDKDRHLLSRAQESGCHVRSPHLINAVRDDGPVVGARSMGRTKAEFGAETVLAHQP